ncbi:hypothetical protein BBJ28_00000833 [Nothophytophthora sp. Chile5]|nr:hypothetical protein BBJ28_00000833 [Nothophytophthora sp. Chile5]
MWDAPHFPVKCDAMLKFPFRTRRLDWNQATRTFKCDERMEKITSFMCVTKQRKAHGKQAEASPSTKKARLAIDQSTTCVAKAETDDEASEGDYVPTFIYEVPYTD